MINWTKNQNEAINLRRKDLLVSASAGSGKTTVMIERISSMISSGEAKLDQLLVLTFTNASASDMRQKLRKKLMNSATLTRNKRDEILSKLALASIGTFHKFCGDLIKMHFNVAEVDPGFDILDDINKAIIQKDILNRLVSKYYHVAKDAIDTFCVTRSTKDICELVITIADFLSSRDDACAWLENIALSSYTNDIETSLAFKKLVTHYQFMGQHYKHKFQDFLMTATQENSDKGKIFVDQCTRLSNELSKIESYNALQNIGKTLFDRLSPKANDFSDYDEFKDVRTTFKSEIAKIGELFFVTKEQAVIAQANDKKIVEQTLFLVKEFIKEYNSAKKIEGKLDFADLERFTLKILGNKDISDSLSNRYKFIFVDEYQDTNPVQEKILSMIGDRQNIFLVGDVKQSIYGFRGCEAAIFSGKLAKYSEHNLDGKVVNLNENFRSNKSILEFVNDVFGTIMTEATAGLDYKSTSMFNASDNMQFPKDSNMSLSKPVEVILLDTTIEDKDNSDDEDGNTRKKQLDFSKPYNLLEDTAEQEETKRIKIQCARVVNKIKELTTQEIYCKESKQMRKIRLSDIAVLGRQKTHFQGLSEMLGYAGIASILDDKKRASNLFEIALLENFLFATSNFYNDLPLVLTMQSFVFGFTSEEMAIIKIKGNGENFFQRIQDFIVKNDNKDRLVEKLQDFVATLEEFHQFTKTSTVADVLARFITRFLITERLLVIPNGDLMVQNIQRYINKLRGFGLASSVPRFLYLLENELLNIEIEGGGGDNERVTLMTVHKSKGLEFPVVILFDTGAKFSNIESRRFMLVDKECGLCVHSTDIENYIKSQSLTRHGALKSGKLNQVAEEMRLLYVALTRAKNKLIIIGILDVEKARASANKFTGHLQNGPSEFEILQSKNYFDFLIPTLFRSIPSSDFELKIEKLDVIKVTLKEKKPLVLSGPVDKELVTELKDRFKKEFKTQIGSSVVFKNSVTSLTRGELETFDKPITEFFPTLTKDRGVDYGTKFHESMQNIDFDKDTKHEDKNVVVAIKILKGFLNGFEIYKEIPFLQTLEHNDAQIIVQGIIDMLAIKKEGEDKRVVLVDYKTNRNASEVKLVEMYRSQMQMYANAIKQAMNIQENVIEIYIYSTTHQKLIRL
ncbi:MAG: UvrD-helicase domain-containing protein [Firmicutes bacterium]|nr:UvrD-helicase domain-containing protein [Bacillota bacterium]